MRNNKSNNNNTLLSLNESSIPSNPIELFDSWFLEHLQSSKVTEPTAMILATVDNCGVPASRIVLLKNFDNNGFTFFTDYNSNKAKQISFTNKISLLFYWPEIECQVRIIGIAKKITAKESDIYFAKRPRGSKLSAWASSQSQVIPNRNYLIAKVNSYKEKFNNSEIPRPDFWGGYIVKPSSIEFWQSKKDRLHDRIIYIKEGESWITKRLAP